MLKKASKKPTPRTVQAAASASAAAASAHGDTENALENEMSALRQQMRNNSVLKRAEEAKLAVLTEALGEPIV